MGGEPTRATEELRLRFPIGLLTMPTGATGLTGIRRVDIDHPHACQRRLIGNESAELQEAPRVQHPPLALRTVDSAADIRQVFQRHAAPCAFRRADHGLRQTVIHILAETFLTSAALPEQALGRLRTLLLQLLPKTAKASAYLIDMAMFRASRVVQKLAITGGRQLDDAQVYAYKISGIRWRGFRRIDRNGEKEGSIPV